MASITASLRIRRPAWQRRIGLTPRMPGGVSGVLRNVGSNWVLIVMTIGASYVTTPFVIHALGDATYGAWTLITALTGYMGLLALGVPMACVRFLAQHVAEKDTDKTNEIIGTCAGLYLMLGAAALAVGAILGIAFFSYDLPSGLHWEALLAYGLMVVYVAFGFVGFLPEGILFAHHDFVPRNLIRVGGVLLRLLLTVGLLTLNASIVALAAIQLVGLVFDFSLSLLLIRRRYPEVRVRLAHFNRGTLRRIVSFSLYVLLLGMGARLSFETDALVIGAVLGLSAIPAYVVANSLFVYLVEFILGIAAVVSPMATTLRAGNRAGELRGLFLQWSRRALVLTMAAAIGLIQFGPRFIGWWIGPQYEQSSGDVLRVLMLSSFVFLPARGVALPMLMGLGKPKTPTLAFIGAGVLNLVMSLVLARPLGLVGVAIGTAIPNVLFALVVILRACRELEVPVTTYVRGVLPRAAVAGVALLAVSLWIELGWAVWGFTGLIAAALTALLTAGVCALFTSLEKVRAYI
jgi:O-antigen/teichoic acid export membrane protein